MSLDSGGRRSNARAAPCEDRDMGSILRKAIAQKSQNLQIKSEKELLWLQRQIVCKQVDCTSNLFSRVQGMMLGTFFARKREGGGFFTSRGNFSSFLPILCSMSGQHYVYTTRGTCKFC
ncbi:uncharacterized protein A4U43_C05F22470 [Asparagus officinalis]|uniref:Uncharacterized protein n=1 Tax=Asparagus officinalis TaxID=4686 RepID=A0A5P1EY21_ASPOF|nr:uncharacterized protein A4U43_C05F22470 [Asparagus officinalis]